MTTSLELQFYMLFSTVLAGITLGWLFDSYRAVRAVFHPRGMALLVGDILFWCTALVVTAAALALGNWGDLQLYVLVGGAAGLALYHQLASPAYLRLAPRMLRWFLRTGARLLQGLWWLLALPAALLGWLLRPVRRVLRAWQTRLGGVGRSLRQRILARLPKESRWPPRWPWSRPPADPPAE